VGQVEAALVEFDLSGEEKPAWLFLINPRSIRYQESANFTAVSTKASPIPHQHYTGGSGTTLAIPDLLLWTFICGKSSKPLLTGLSELMKAKPDRDLFTPPLLLLRMGRLRFGPCVLSQIEREETAWLDGDPAQVKLSITLLEVPRPLSEAEKAAVAERRAAQEAAARERQGQPRTALTDRQQQEASTLAKEWLEGNTAAFAGNVQALLNSDRYTLRVSADTGDVTMLGSDGAAIGVVLRYTGRAVRTQGVTTVPLAQGQSLPAAPTVPNATTEEVM